MPVLNWLGKDKIINHHNEVPYKVLNRIYSYDKENGKSDIDNKSKNMIIHGDNLFALKSLMPKYEGMVDVIYIDPPYNTAHSTNKNQKWIYSDNVDSPIISKWLNKVVGDEGEDLSRHDKWLCMMYPRLKLLYKLLKNEGVIFISIDDNELAYLKVICDEILGQVNFCGQFMWYKSATPPNLSTKIKKNLEYVLCYQKYKDNKKFSGYTGTSKSTDPSTKPQNTLKLWKFLPKQLVCNFDDCIIKAGIYGTKKFPNVLKNDLIIENGTNKNVVEFENKFIWKQETLEETLKSATMYLSKNLVLSYKRDEYDDSVPSNLINEKMGVGTTEEAGVLVDKILNGNKVFDYPKPIELVEYLSQFIKKDNVIILDSFAGSGTTAHAILDLNNKDGGNRQFILIEMEDYADSITAERVKRVIDGYGNGKDKVEGLSGDFSYYELGDTIIENGVLNENVDVEVIKKYIYWTETKNEYNKNDKDTNCLGIYDDTAYYMFYIKDKITTLDFRCLKEIRIKAKKYVIYADILGLSKEELEKFNITFKKIPRDIKKV